MRAQHSHSEKEKWPSLLTDEGYGLFFTTGIADRARPKTHPSLGRHLGDLGHKFLWALSRNSLLLRRKSAACGEC